MEPKQIWNKQDAAVQATEQRNECWTKASTTQGAVIPEQDL